MSEFLGQGVLVSHRSLEFTYTKLPKKRVDMLAKATKTDSDKRRGYCTRAGSNIDAVKKVTTGL